MTPERWDPAQYNRFASEREQPFVDLVGLLEPVHRPRVVDLGCGDGRMTAWLHRELGADDTLGIDSSPAMVAGARAHAGSGLRFELGDIGTWAAPGARDILVANASLHWVPDHPSVLARWSRSLRPGGQLAIQVPANADHPAHRLAGEMAAEVLADPPGDPVAGNVLAPEAYAVLLEELGFERPHVRLQVYLHHLTSTDDVVEWVKGTTLTRFKDPLGPAGWDRFVDRYRDRLAEVLGRRSPYVYSFKRILMWGRRG